MPSKHTNEPTGQQHRIHGENAGHQQSTQSRSKSTDEIADTYADVADKLARWRGLDRLVAGRYRRRQFQDATGRVLDVACGTGRNFKHLRSASEVVGIDISDAMLTYARDELDNLELQGSVEQMDAQSLHFADDSFDTVISSFSTCTFPDPTAALREMERVCAPDGEILLLEHRRSDARPLAWFQDWRAEAHYEDIGCRLNHEPLATVECAGLPVESSSTSWFGLLATIDATPR